MADVAQLSIRIDDSEWQTFQERLKQFRGEEAAAPEAWRGVAAQVDALAARFAEVGKALDREAQASERVRNNAGNARSTIGDLSLTWSLMAPHVRRAGGSVAGITREFAKWERLTATFTALLGAGGLFGLDNLASRAARRRQDAAGSGVSTGQLAAFQANFGRLGDTGGLLAGFNRAATDRTAQTPLQALGVDPRGKNALDLFAEALPRVKEVVDRTDPKLLGPTLGAYHLDQLGFDEQMLRLIKRMQPSEIAEMQRSARGDAGRFDIPDEIGRKWQELETQLTRAGNRIQTALADSLVNIAPGVTHVSESLVHLVDTLMARPELKQWLDGAAAGVEGLATRVGSSAAQDALKKAVERFKMSQQDFAKLNDWFDAHGKMLERVFGALVGARVGGIFGPVGAAVGATLGATGNLPTHFEGDGAAREKQRAGGAADERRGSKMNDPRVNDALGGGQAPANTPGPAPSAAPGSASAYDKDLAGDISGSSTYSRIGEKITPEAFVVHHTGGRGTPESTEATLNQRGLGVQYIMGRDGKIYRSLPEGNRAAHILPSEVKGLDLSNSNTFGMEVIAKDDSDVTPAQIESARKFYKDLKAKYPTIKEAYGHGYLNPGHKQATEGKTITDAIHADEHAAPLPTITPAMAGAAAAKGVPTAQRGFMGSAYGGTGLAPHPNSKPPAAPVVHVTDNTGGESNVQVHH